MGSCVSVLGTIPDAVPLIPPVPVTTPPNVPDAVPLNVSGWVELPTPAAAVPFDILADHVPLFSAVSMLETCTYAYMPPPDAIKLNPGPPL